MSDDGDIMGQATYMEGDEEVFERLPDTVVDSSSSIQPPLSTMGSKEATRLRGHPYQQP